MAGNSRRGTAGGERLGEGGEPGEGPWVQRRRGSWSPRAEAFSPPAHSPPGVSVLLGAYPCWELAPRGHRWEWPLPSSQHLALSPSAPSLWGAVGGAPELQGSTETGRDDWRTQGWLRHYRVGRGPLAGEAGGRKGQPDPTAGRRGGGSQGGVGVIGLTPGPTEPGQRDTDEKSHVSQARTRGRKASSAASVAGTEPAGGRRGPTQTRQRCGCQPGPAPAPAPRGSE